LGANPRRIYVWIAIGIGVAIATAIAFTSNPIPIPDDRTSKIKVFPPDSKPYGKTYLEYSIAMWRMIQSIPRSENPVFDTTGSKCQVSQNDPNVWYASGTAGGSAERKCTISASKAPLIPVVAGECSFLEDKSANTDEKRRACITAGTKNAIMNLFVDGQDIPNLKDYWAEGAIRDVPFIKDNMWGAEEGITDEWAAGYYVLLEPLPPGEHVIHWEAAVTSIEGTQLFALDVTYHLTVE